MVTLTGALAQFYQVEYLVTALLTMTALKVKLMLRSMQ
jgi:hypothetical protein